MAIEEEPGPDEATAPVDGAKVPISEARAAARRANGRKSKGPNTERGKAFSSRNARRHGAYEKTMKLIDAGPLRDDPDEYERLRSDVHASLPSVATPLLFELADRVADA